MDVFIIGSKGIPARYGGFETFVENLVRNSRDNDVTYHVSCLNASPKEFNYAGARCFSVRVPNVGSAKAVLYDIVSLISVVQYVRQNRIRNSIVYILASRIGPFLFFYKWILRRLGIKVLLNPDGHEWKRAKWNALIKKYWKLSERLMVKYSDLIICDSKGIQDYIIKNYSISASSTAFIPYGATETVGELHNDIYTRWLDKWDLQAEEYYLVVGRFVPENNYETILKEFSRSSTKKSLVIVTNIEENKFYRHLMNTTRFQNDNRIKFVGTIYDQGLLQRVRHEAFAYIHGHEVGGTNPSLLESLATTNLNILFDVVFNREVAEECALYFNKDEGSLRNTLNIAEQLDVSEQRRLGEVALGRIKAGYTWNKVTDAYLATFKSIGGIKGGSKERVDERATYVN